MQKLREKVKNVLFISNLTFHTTEKDLSDFLKENHISSVIDLHLVKDEEGKSKGFGFVELESIEEMKSAVELSGKLLKNRPISIKESNRNITKKREPEREDIENEKPTKRRKKDKRYKELTKRAE